jgi:hypothetical protein
MLSELATIHASTVSRFQSRNLPPMPMSALGNRPDEIIRKMVRDAIGRYRRRIMANVSSLGISVISDTSDALFIAKSPLQSSISDLGTLTQSGVGHFTQFQNLACGPLTHYPSNEGTSKKTALSDRWWGKSVGMKSRVPIPGFKL